MECNYYAVVKRNEAERDWDQEILVGFTSRTRHHLPSVPAQSEWPDPNNEVTVRQTQTEGRSTEQLACLFHLSVMKHGDGWATVTGLKVQRDMTSKQNAWPA